MLDGYIFVPKAPMQPPVWTVHKDAFAVRFAERSAPMLETYKDIMAYCKTTQEAKLKEKAKKQTKYEELVEKLENFGPCMCLEQDTGPRFGFGGHFFRQPKCDRCQLEKQVSDLKVEFYSRLLPTCGTKFERNEHMAVVYELQQPGLLSVQRDAFYLFAREVAGSWQDKKAKDKEFGEFNKPKEKVNKVMFFWRADECLQRWNSARDGLLKLGSTTKKALCRGTKKWCDTLKKAPPAGALHSTTVRKCECNFAHVTKAACFIVNHGFDFCPTFSWGQEQEGTEMWKLKCSMDEWNWLLQKRYHEVRLTQVGLKRHWGNAITG